MITNSTSGTNIHEIAADIYRINTPVSIPGTPGFSFNQYLVVDDEPFLFHTGLRGLFPVVSEAIAAVMPVARLKYVGEAAHGGVSLAVPFTEISPRGPHGSSSCCAPRTVRPPRLRGGSPAASSSFRMK